MRRMIFILCIAVITSCVREEVISLDVENNSHKLVVLGFLTPGDSIQVYVGRSIPIGSPAIGSNELNASVFLSADNGEQVELKLENPNIPIYTCSQMDFPIIEGTRYKIEVSASGLQTVTSSTQVPKEKALWTSTVLSQSNDGQGEFIGTWNALADESDVDYGVSVYLKSEPRDLLIGNESIIPVHQTYRVQRNVYYGNNMHAVLITRTKPVGDFSKMAELTIEMSSYYSGAGFFDIISGFKGVIPEESNILGGLGVFGAYLTHTVPIEI